MCDVSAFELRDHQVRFFAGELLNFRGDVLGEYVRVSIVVGVEPAPAARFRDLDLIVGVCQSARNWDPGSASKRDPPFLRFERLALAPSELVGVAETGRARVVV